MKKGFTLPSHCERSVAISLREDDAITTSNVTRSSRNDRNISLFHKTGFTLAEVLITLGIIGVVAAMTLPTVINKTEKIILKNQFKKAYSVYSQALLKTAVDYDGMPNCYYQANADGVPSGVGQDKSGCFEFYNKFANNMKIIKKCEGNALDGGCIPKYSAFSGNAGCEGFSETAFNQTNTVYVIADGTIMIPYANKRMPIFAFDINGKKGPNIPGQDLFSLNILRTTNGMLQLYAKSITGCLPVPPGSMKYEDIFK